MTLENIKQKLAIEKYGYENGFHNLFHEMWESGKANILLDDLCCEYAKQKCKEQREICAVEAGTKKYSQEIDQDTIRNAYEPKFD